MKTLNLPLKKETKTGIGQPEFEQIFNSWYNALVNFIYYKSGDVQAAEDITQETFLKIWEMKDEIRLNTVRPLLYKIAGNLYTNDYHRKDVVMKFINSYIEKNNPESPEYQMEMKEFDAKLQKVLSGLSEKNRVVFLMNRIDDLTYKDIATNLGISVKAVEKRMKNALEYLRTHIDMKM